MDEAPKKPPLEGFRHDLAVDPKHRAVAEKVARSCYGAFRGRVPLDILAGEANLSLYVAAARFDPEKGTGFATFLAYVARGYMLAAGNRWLPIGGRHNQESEVRVVQLGGNVVVACHGEDADWTDYHDEAEFVARKAGSARLRKTLLAYLTRADCLSIGGLAEHLGIERSAAVGRLHRAIGNVGGARPRRRPSPIQVPGNPEEDS